MSSDTSFSRLPYQPELQHGQSTSELKPVYQPVGAGKFRVLEVKGYDDNGFLDTSLHIEPLQGSCSYVAISYTWNEKDRLWYGSYDSCPKPIRINGILVLVPDKVANIISLAFKYGRSNLWIDAMCINQSDLVEKSDQVSRMGDVYGSATEVLAMIGSPSEASDTVLDASNAFEEDSSQQFPPVVMAKISKFINGDYWTRAWILQELTLAKSTLVCCGTKASNLQSIVKLGKHLEDKVQQTESLRELLQYRSFIGTALGGHVMRRVLYSAKDMAALDEGPGESLLGVLENSRNYYGCFDPRDMLYSRLALASDAATLIPYPDYTIDVEELYKQFATNCITMTKSLRVITFANSTKMDLPSWVPDWSFKQRQWDVSKEFVKLGEEIAQLSWEERDLPHVSHDHKELTTQGRVLGAVSKRDWLETIASRTMGFSQYARAYHPSDIARKGDFLCILRSCPLPVHLRPVDNHFVIVGRHSSGRSYGAEVGLTVDKTESDTTYRFASFEHTQKLPEIVFTIR